MLKIRKKPEVPMFAFEFKLTNKILMKAGEIEPKNDKTIYVFAGPNGSGKSTLLANLYFKHKLEAQYVNADLFCNKLFSDIENLDERNKKSMYYTMELVDNYIREGKSFCYETVLSHPSKLELLKKAKSEGYKIIAIYVKTVDPRINIERVERRTKQGGHYVPDDKVISRYYRSRELSKELRKIADKFYKIDNSIDKSITKDYEIDTQRFEI